MRRVRTVSATTRARRSRAFDNDMAVRTALRDTPELVLRVSNRTDVDAGTVHHGLAHMLVRLRCAEWMPDAERAGWRDMSRIRAVAP